MALLEGQQVSECECKPQGAPSKGLRGHPDQIKVEGRLLSGTVSRLTSPKLLLATFNYHAKKMHLLEVFLQFG